VGCAGVTYQGQNVDFDPKVLHLSIIPLLPLSDTSEMLEPNKDVKRKALFLLTKNLLNAVAICLGLAAVDLTLSP